MNGKKLLTTLAISAMLFTGCGLKSGETIIKVNDDKISQAQFDTIFDKQASNSMFAQLGINVKNNKNNFLYYMMKERIVNELIVRTLIDEEIAKRKIEVTNEDIEQAVREVIDKIGSKEELDKVLKQNGVSVSDFKKDLKEEVKMKKLAQDLGVGEVSDNEVKDFYNKNMDKFKHPERVRASHILITADPDQIKDITIAEDINNELTPEQIQVKVDEVLNVKKARAEELLAQLKQDHSQFAKLAKENSEDPTTAIRGGDLGFFAEQEMVPEFSKAAFSTKPDSVFPNLVKSQYGYHIIMVVDRMEASQDSFEKAEPEIKAFLENQKQLEAIDKLVESLKKNAKIEYVNSEYDPENIKKEMQEMMKKQAEKDAAKDAETKPVPDSQPESDNK